MHYTVIIHRELPGFNEYSRKERSYRMEAAIFKKNLERDLIMEIKSQIGNVELKTPVAMVYRWYKSHTRMDKDNLAFAKKFVQDALVKNGNLKNDGWKYIDRFYDEFFIDKENPRVEVVIMEVEE